MFKTLIISHGPLADCLLDSARTIVGDLPPDGFQALSLAWDDGLAAAGEKVGQAIDGLGRDDGVLLLVDMYGSTPFNAASSFLDPGRVEMVTGVNLPMVVRLGCLFGREMDLSEAVTWVAKKAKGGICKAVEPPQSVVDRSLCEDPPVPEGTTRTTVGKA